MRGDNICKFNPLRSSDLVCTDFVYETENGQASEQIYTDYMLALVVSGSGTLLQGNARHPLVRGTLFAVGSGKAFAVEGTDALCYVYIRFHGRRAEELAARFGFEQLLCVADAERYGDALIDFVLSALRHADEGNLDLVSESALLYVLSHIDSAARAQDGLMGKMLSLTNDRFTDVDFSLSELSHTLGYDAKYLSFYFKSKRGVGFSAYLRELRIKRAIFLMEQGVASVKNVAILAGFGDALYFSKIFKQETGVSPKEYIERLSK